MGRPAGRPAHLSPSRGGGGAGATVLPLGAWTGRQRPTPGTTIPCPVSQLSNAMHCGMPACHGTSSPGLRARPSPLHLAARSAPTIGQLQLRHRQLPPQLCDRPVLLRQLLCGIAAQPQRCRHSAEALVRGGARAPQGGWPRRCHASAWHDDESDHLSSINFNQPNRIYLRVKTALIPFGAAAALAPALRWPQEPWLQHSRDIPNTLGSTLGSTLGHECVSSRPRRAHHSRALR